MGYDRNYIAVSSNCPLVFPVYVYQPPEINHLAISNKYTVSTYRGQVLIYGNPIIFKWFIKTTFYFLPALNG